MKSLRMIGLAKHIRGLYHTNSSLVNIRAISCNVVTRLTSPQPSVNFDQLWHFRSRHLSFQRLKFLSSHFANITYSSRVSSLYDVC